MKWTEVLGLVLGSGLAAALLNQLFDGVRLSRQLKAERRLRLDDMRRTAYFEYVMYLKRLPQRIVDGLVSYSAADAVAVNELQQRVADEAKAARTSLSFCASDAVSAIVDAKGGPALDRFTSERPPFSGDIGAFADALNGSAEKHISPYLGELLDVMAKDFRE